MPAAAEDAQHLSVGQHVLMCIFIMCRLCRRRSGRSCSTPTCRRCSSCRRRPQSAPPAPVPAFRHVSVVCSVSVSLCVVSHSQSTGKEEQELVTAVCSETAGRACRCAEPAVSLPSPLHGLNILVTHGAAGIVERTHSYPRQQTLIVVRESHFPHDAGAASGGQRGCRHLLGRHASASGAEPHVFGAAGGGAASGV